MAVRKVAVNTEVGNMPSEVKSKQFKPMTKIEKKHLRRLQRMGKSMKRERYENYQARRQSFKKPLGSMARGKQIQSHGMKNIGGPELGFQVHFDKGRIKKTLKKYNETFARAAHFICTREAVAAGKNAAWLALKSQSRHMSNITPGKKVEGDIFDHLAGSLANFEDEKGRWLRYVAGSFDKNEEPEGRVPTGLKGWHTGKKVNLAEMYEEGVDPFPYSDKLFFLVAGEGARRSRDANYVAVLKGNHPGFPRVGFLAKWQNVTLSELSQRNYNRSVDALADAAGGYMPTGPARRRT